jgi:DNA polymerase-4
MPRTIIHADLDAFFASVEQLDNPELLGKPVVVGGSPEHRGVVAAASYEARRFGVRSAMPMSRAMRLCPDAVRVPPRFERYGELSRQVMAIFRALTPLVERLSFDEAFLDVSAIAADAANAEHIARDLKRDVKEATGLTVSIGMGTSKSVAKIASDMGKPDGLVIVPPGDEARFLAPLPVRALWGVGPKTEAVLTRLGTRTIADLARLDDAAAERLLGSRGLDMRDLARGIDDAPVVTQHERKSVGAETTFTHDLADGAELRAALREIAEQVAQRLQHAAVKAHTVAIKLRYSDFRTITRQSSLKTPVDNAGEIASVAARLLSDVATPNDRFRLLGIHASKLTGDVIVQGVLWDDWVGRQISQTATD